MSLVIHPPINLPMAREVQAAIEGRARARCYLALS